jgi:hypothetical protein
MKKIILAALLAAASFGAYAKRTPLERCLFNSSVMGTAATLRDLGKPLQETLDIMRMSKFDFEMSFSMLSSDFTEEDANYAVLKPMVMAVYGRDPESVYILPAQEMSTRIGYFCMLADKKAHPEKY